MGWIARKIQKMLENEYKTNTKTNTSIRQSEEDLGEGMSITLYNASGGKIIRFRRYDRKDDRNYSITYVIQDDADLGKSLSELITIENLK